MPVAAAAFLQRIADFLTVGAAPQASTEAGAEFSLHLAAKQAGETGKPLPLDRQDLAGASLDLPPSGLDQTGEDVATPALSPVPADAPPSTTSILVAADTLPLVPVAIAETPLPAAPQALPVQIVPSDDDDAEVPQEPVQVTVQAMARSTAPAIKQPPEPAVSPTRADGKAGPSAHLPEGKKPSAPAAKSAPEASAASHPKLPAANGDASVAAPQPEAMVATPDVAAPQPIPSAQPAQADAARTETAPAPVIAETAQAEVIPAPGAAPIPAAQAEIATPSSQPDTQAQPVRTVRQTSSAALKQHHSAHAAKLAEPAKLEVAAAAPAPPALDASPTIIAPAIPDTPAVPAAADIAAPIATPIATAVVLPAPITAPTIDDATAPAPPSPVPAAVATIPEQASTNTPPAAVDLRAPTQSSAPAVPVLPTAPNVVAAAPLAVVPARPAGVSFIARATRVTSANAPTSGVASSAPETKSARAAAQPAIDTPPAAERDALPFRATAKQILAAQPDSSTMPHAADLETAVRTPVPEAAPTIAQHLMPAAHNGERIIATPAPSSQTNLSTEQAAALVETIQMLRSEAKSDAMTLAVDHDELGRITMRFDRTDHGVAVRIDSPDPSVTQLIANSTPALKSSGDGVGMRFERQDASGSGAGTSRDAPRQGAGQDRNTTPYAQSSRPRASGQRDGLFA